MKNTSRISHVKHTTLPLSCVCFAMLSCDVIAADFKYSSIEAGYSQTSLEIPGLEQTDLVGYTFTGSYALHPNIVVGASFSAASADSTARFEQSGLQSVELEASGPTAFAFLHAPLSANTDYLIGGAFNQFETEGTRSGGVAVPELSTEGDSKSIFAGLRHQLNTNIELGLRADYDLDAEDDEDEFSFDAQVRYALDSSLDVGLAYSPDDDGDTTTINFRAYF